MNNKEIPPGIIAFKCTDGTSNKLKYDFKSNWAYSLWAKFWLKRNNPIHTISVEGKEWSVGDVYKAGSSFTHQIKSFEWHPSGYWRIIDTDGDWSRVSSGLIKIASQEYTIKNNSDSPVTITLPRDDAADFQQQLDELKKRVTELESKMNDK